MKMTLKDVGLFIGGITVGATIVAVAVKKSISKIKNEIKETESKLLEDSKESLRKEVVSKIKDDIHYENIVADVKNNIVNDVTEETKKNMNQFIEVTNEQINIFNNRLKTAENNVLDMDKRIGKMITSIISKLMKAKIGDYYEN